MVVRMPSVVDFGVLRPTLVWPSARRAVSAGLNISWEHDRLFAPTAESGASLRSVRACRAERSCQSRERFINRRAAVDCNPSPAQQQPSR